MYVRKMSCELFFMLLSNRGVAELITGIVFRLKLFIIRCLEAQCSTVKISSRATNSLEMKGIYQRKFSHKKKFLLNQYVNNNN